MSDHGGSPPAGWFPDPAQAWMLRWWDGRQWTQYTHPMPPPQPVYGWMDPQRAVSDERSTARWARNVIVVYGLLTLATAYVMARLFAVFMKQFATLAANPETMPQDPSTVFTPLRPFFAVFPLLYVVQLGMFVFLLVWMYRAARAAAALRIPAQLSPGWAIGGWFVPVVNLWFPCQSLRDLLPPGHPTRTRILWLWVIAIAGQFVPMFGFFSVFVSSSGTVVVMVGGVMVAVALATGRTVVDDVLACHEQLVATGRPAA